MLTAIVGAGMSVAAIVGAASCAAPQPQPEPFKPACQGAIVEIVMGAPLDCDIAPPQVLIEVNTPTAESCATMGGTFVAAKWEGRPNLCVDIDY